MARSRPSLVEFPADDPQRARRFWGDLLGLELVAREPEQGEGWQARPGEVAVGVHQRGRGPGDSVSLPYFEVEDLKSSLGRVSELGGSVVHPGERWAICRDSEGSPFGLAASPASGPGAREAPIVAAASEDKRGETSMSRTAIHTDQAPEAIGPYSQAIRHGGLLYCSGAIPLDPATGEADDSSLAAETRRCLANLAAVCAAAGTELARALKLTVYTTELGQFAEINEAYAEFFDSDPPARATVGVAALPKGVRVEVDAIVAIE